MPKTREDAMSQVMKLLSLAADPNTSEHERKLAEEHAERLMLQHTIDRMELKAEEKSRISQETWEVRIGDATQAFQEQHSEYGYSILRLVEDVLRHCHIRIHPNYAFGKVDGTSRTDFGLRVLTVVGYPEDISYANRIWFNVFKAFVGNVNPTWDDSKHLGENCHNFLSAGFKWGKIWQIAFDRQPKTGYKLSRSTVIIPDPKTNKYCSSLKAATKEYLLSQGKEYISHTQRHEAYRTSFARSYSSTITKRLQEMRRKAEHEVGDSDRYALALVDTDKQVQAEFYRLYPEYDPAVRKRQQEEEAFKAWCKAAELWQSMTPEEQQKAYLDAAKEAERIAKEEAAAEKRYQSRKSTANRNFRTVRAPKYSPGFDQSAWARGNDAASKVNLNVHEQVNNQPKGEIK